MKRHVCYKCRQEIDSKDFFMIARSGKICSECLIEAGPLDAGSAHLFRRRGPKWEPARAKEVEAPTQFIPLEEAL